MSDISPTLLANFVNLIESLPPVASVSSTVKISQVDRVNTRACKGMGEHSHGVCVAIVCVDIRRQALLSVIRFLSAFGKGLALAPELHQISQVS